jgi:hypothetical protein
MHARLYIFSGILLYRTCGILCSPRKLYLKGLSHEIDFKNVDENGQILD